MNNKSRSLCGYTEMFESLRRAISNLMSKIVYKELSEKDLKSIMFEFELSLISSDVASHVAREIVENITRTLHGKIVRRFSDIRSIIRVALEEELKKIIGLEPLDIVEHAKKRRRENIEAKYETWRPLVVVFLGPNGCGKTTTIAKLAYRMKKEKLSIVLACADTFRAGAIEQLEKHAKKLGVYMVRREYGADPASVGYDAVSHAIAKKRDVVLIDTAGRLGTNIDLIGEMKKIVRVTSPDVRCLVVDALMGNDLVTQARMFSQEIGIDCSILTKVDADVKGGAAITLCYVTKKPISYIGIGQKYEDLKKFDPNWFIEKIFGSS